MTKSDLLSKEDTLIVVKNSNPQRNQDRRGEATGELHGFHGRKWQWLRAGWYSEGRQNGMASWRHNCGGRGESGMRLDAPCRFERNVTNVGVGNWFCGGN